jgi:tetratricopeptide (TPR) repeat protein
LNNTPASQEDQYSKEEDVSNWKVTEIPYIEYIEKTMSLFSKGNYKKALSRYELILDSYPTDINANFYGGLSYFNLGEFEKSIQTFERCLNSEFNNFNEEAEWYLAKSYSANGQNEKASQLFKQISENGGYYSKQALKFLN